MRPHQWVKNLFVAAPLVFSKHLLDGGYLLRSAVAVLAFCGLSAAVYAFNDVRDAEADRAHPKKRLRPIASGALSERAGLVLASTLAVSALGAAAALGLATLALAAAYLGINLSYSLGLKRLAFVDVALISAGFLVRVLAGATAIDVAPSGWLLVCTALLAAYLGLGKRAHELASLRTQATRASLAGYRLGDLRSMMVALAVATTAAYVLYAVSDHTAMFFGTGRLVWTSPFCAIGLARFAMLSFGDAHGVAESPTEAMLRDRPFLINLAAWAVAVVAIIYVA